MSKLSTRIALSVLISLVVIAGIYTTVFGASSAASEKMAGSHLVSGAKVNLDHYREANPAPLVPAGASEFMRSNGYGGCEHENRTSPDD
jgi:hypothetical protein